MTKSQLILNVSVRCGARIEETVSSAIDAARRTGMTVSFKFNGIYMEVNADTEVADGIMKYHNKIEREAKMRKLAKSRASSPTK